MRLSRSAAVPGAPDHEGYRLTVGPGGVTLTAVTTHGLYNGIQTIRQLLPVWIDRPSVRPGPWTIGRVYELFAWMRERRHQRTAQLSGGEQQSVAIGRALVANPRVLLLDELSLGLAPVVVQRIYAMLPQILETGLTVLLVEQDVSQALAVASRVHCLLEGRTTLEGEPGDLTPDRVEAAYFGLGHGDSPVAGTDSGGGDGGQPVPSAGQPAGEAGQESEG